MSLPQRNRKRQRKSYFDINSYPKEIIQNLPGVEKTFTEVHIQRKGDSIYPISATYPILTTAAKSLTFAAYNIYVKEYNKTLRTLNHDIKNYNIDVDFFIKQKKPHNWKNHQVSFCKNYKKLSTKEYNQTAVAYNTKFGQLLIPQKKIQSIKQTTAKVFEVMLWEYAHQLLSMEKAKESSWTKIPTERL